jgi:NarL family two-component system response regulator LiaR
MNERIKVLLVDDHLVVRKGLIHVLNKEPDIKIIAEAETGEEAIYLCQKHQPDVILMDVTMDGMGGVEATRLIHKHHKSARLIGLSTFANPEIVGEMMEAGASGYLLKDVSAQILADAIRKVQAGEKLPASDQLLKAQLDAMSPSTTSSDADTDFELGPKQQRVLALMTKGFTNPEIAEKLSISAPTARYHVSTILKKLDVSNRSEAVAVAIRLDLVKAEDF